EVVIVDLRWHVQAPAVRSEAQPVLGHVEHELAHARVGDVQLREGGQVPPGQVAEVTAPVGVQRVPVHEEPVEVWALLPVLQHVVELQEAAASVVENAVEDDSYAALMCAVEELS